MNVGTPLYTRERSEPVAFVIENGQQAAETLIAVGKMQRRMQTKLSLEAGFTRQHLSNARMLKTISLLAVIKYANLLGFDLCLVKRDA